MLSIVTERGHVPVRVGVYVEGVPYMRTLDNRCRGLMRKVKIWAFWTGQNRKIFLKFIRMKSGQHPKPKFSSGLCIRPPKLEKSSGPAHQASKKAPGVWMTP